MAEKVYGIAADIGTTTLVCALTDRDGNILAKVSAPNKGAVYGADVMSRIQAAAGDRLVTLRDLLRSQLTSAFAELTSAAALPGGAETEITLSGNTAMMHILRGLDCSGLGTYPYTPVTVEAAELRADELFDERAAGLSGARVHLFPGISGFVGADIVSGLYSLGIPFDDLPRPLLFADIGTNGEMAVVTGRGEDAEIKVCSTAAGPVFEGAGIRSGMPAGKGAISEVYIRPPEIRCRVIGGGEPSGICGSGILEAVSELARTHMIDRTGLLSEPWFTDGLKLAGDVRIYQEDIRAVQLAKAAVRAGTETLPLSCGIRAQDVAQLVIAGAFGTALNMSRLSHLGMFNEALLGRCRIAGNTSLAGAVKFASDIAQGRKKEAMSRIRLIAERSVEISLADRQDFKALYMSVMGF